MTPCRFATDDHKCTLSRVDTMSQVIASPPLQECTQNFDSEIYLCWWYEEKRDT